MLKPIVISYKLTMCQLLDLTNTYKPREILITIHMQALKLILTSLVEYELTFLS